MNDPRYPDDLPHTAALRAARARQLAMQFGADDEAHERVQAWRRVNAAFTALIRRCKGEEPTVDDDGVLPHD